jgi:hypothetical protein
VIDEGPVWAEYAVSSSGGLLGVGDDRAARFTRTGEPALGNPDYGRRIFDRWVMSLGGPI